MTSLQLVVVGVAGERLDLLTDACSRAGISKPHLVSYGRAAETLFGHDTLLDERGTHTVVRFESTDEDAAAFRQYLCAGATVDDPDEPGAQRMTAQRAHELEPDVGAIVAMRQSYLGQNAVRRNIESVVSSAGASVMNSAEGLAATFDKRLTSARLHQASIRVPFSPGPARCFDEVASLMSSAQLRQVMVKSAHGSGATGIVALRTDGSRWHAHTTAVLEQDRLFNTRRVRALREVSAIAPLIDALCQQVVHVEEWIPKAIIHNKQFDLRVVVIDGTARHVLPRLSSGPFTNLHLGGERGDAAGIRSRVGLDVWNNVLHSAERSVAAVGGLLYAGVDVMIHADLQSVSVLEVNGFGDWHPGILVDGKDTYDWELMALASRLN
jgi:glutathione synthase/RimK-type ligase-like ATP-grasp enzyme